MDAGGAPRAAGVGRRAGPRPRVRGRRCPDCGAAMLYYPHLSSPRAPDGRRVLAYACPECTDDFERPQMVVVRLGGDGGDPPGIESIDVEIIERARPRPREVPAEPDE